MPRLHPRTNVDDKDDVADLKVMKILEQRLRHCMSGTSTYSHTYGNHDNSQNPVSSRDAEVDGFVQGSENSATRRRVAVVIPVSYAALRVATRREKGSGRRPGCGRHTREVVGGGRGGRARGILCLTLPLGAFM
jgi:hypothetical protein